MKTKKQIKSLIISYKNRINRQYIQKNNIDIFKDFYEYIKENNHINKTAYKYIEHKYENKFKRITRHFVILDFNEILNWEELRRFLKLYNIMDKEGFIKFCNEYKGEN